MVQPAGKPGTDETQKTNAPDDARASPSGATAQRVNDEREKSRHSGSENDLESMQDKNPVPPDATRRS